jgi:capsular polysaccharide transport system permease protein
MSTPPKVRKFRTRSVTAPVPDSAAATATGRPFAPAPEDDGFGQLSMFQTRRKGQVRAAAPADRPETATASAEELAAVRAEGLSARQLRLARRVALRQGITAQSDEEAVVLLRRQGINPFRHELSDDLVIGTDLTVGAEGGGTVKAEGQAKGKQTLPSTEVLSENERARAIIDMQRDIVRRRRRNFAMLMLRLAAFVFLPTILAGWYYYRLATPMFATKSEFLIQQAESQGAAGLGSLFRGTQLATSQDSIAVQSYLQSRDAMLRLDRALGFKAHFAQVGIDVLQRLEADATNEDAYKLYRRNVKIAYDPTEGIVKMEVIAADPATSAAFAEALLSFAEEQVDQLTQRVRADQMQGARESYAEAEEKVQAAEAKVLDLQEKLGVLDPTAESTATMAEVAQLETLLREKQLELDQLLDNAKPNQARVDGVRGDMARLQTQIDGLRQRMTSGENGNLSLARITGQLRIAETELQTRQAMLAQALQQQETARIEANRQVRYLSTSVAPIAPDEATYPKAFENTALAFMIFAGIYLMLSLTASILREQVTA